jgi:hypothetical protein
VNVTEVREDAFSEIWRPQDQSTQEVRVMAKSKPSGISYRDHDIKEDHSFAPSFGVKPGVHKKYSCKVGGRTVKGSLEEVKAKIDAHLNPDKAGGNA